MMRIFKIIYTLIFLLVGSWSFSWESPLKLQTSILSTVQLLDGIKIDLINEEYLKGHRDLEEEVHKFY